jgi:GTP cyclohydrolase I
LGKANLDAESLAGPSSSQSSHTPAPAAGLDCGRDPGRSAEEMDAYTKSHKAAKASKDNSGPQASSSSSAAPLRRSTEKGILVDDGRSNFEDAVERRLAATMSSKLDLSHGEEEYGTDYDDRIQSLRGRQASSRSGTRTPVADENGLGWPAKGSLTRMHSTADQTAQTTAKLSEAVRTILECLGEDPEREGLKRTPERYAKALLWMTRGYEERLSDVISNAIFDEEHDEMVIVRNIEISSLCEHHLVPFRGKVSDKEDE